MHNNGYPTLAALAAASPAALRQLLSEVGGSRLQMHDPSTWPAQAALAKDEKWTELLDLQKNLKEGAKQPHQIMVVAYITAFILLLRAG
ncbi:MAG: hypothetical protein HC821_04790 [Lewinella sp.]|nr:hypothetical protein [Lewinella sp.]